MLLMVDWLTPNMKAKAAWVHLADEDIRRTFLTCCGVNLARGLVFRSGVPIAFIIL